MALFQNHYVDYTKIKKMLNIIHEEDIDLEGSTQNLAPRDRQARYFDALKFANYLLKIRVLF